MSSHYSNGSTGIAYQLTPEDPLVDTKQCAMDADLMKTLGANAIRVYHVDPEKDHDGCMTAFSNAGIYLFLDLDTFDTMILGAQPAFNDTQFQSFAKVLDNFQQYDNLAGVFVGNEVLTVPTDSPSAPYVKAAAANIKAYRDRMKYRKIPVGYSAADIASLRPMLQNYLVCGGNNTESIDFFGLNAYEWCGTQDYQTSGYVNLQNMAEGFPVPIFFSETGCNTNRPRTFADQAAIFGPNMSSTWSGAIIYEWIEEANDYGLVSFPNGGVSGSPTPVQPDFSNLMTAWSSISPSSTPLSAYSASASSLSTPACPSKTAGAWEVDGNPALPTVGQAYSPTDVPTGVVTTGVPSVTHGSSGSGSAAGTAAAASGTGSGAAAATSSSVASAMRVSHDQGRLWLGVQLLGPTIAAVFMVTVLLQ